MVKITFSDDSIDMWCSRCETSKTITTSHFFDEIDAVLELCPHCFGDVLTEKIRQFQRDEGNPDCFGKANGYCVRTNCKFHRVCTNRRYF